MARIRTIKPEFPQSETIGSLSRDARLLFIQLWTIVDDAGRARGASRMLASLLYPYDADAGALMDGWLEELQRRGCIRRYTVDGSQYLEVCNWLKHQKIDRPSESRLPSFDEASPSIREHSRGLDADLGPRTSNRTCTLDLGAKEERAVLVGNLPATIESSPSPKGRKKAAAPIPEDFALDDEMRAAAGARGVPPGEVDAVFRDFKDYWLGRGEARADWKACFRTWCSKRNDFKPRAATQRQPTLSGFSPIVDLALQAGQRTRRED